MIKTMKTKTVLLSILLTILIERSFTQSCEIGSYAPNPANCNSFLQCLHGSFIVMPCPAGLHWNRLAQTCDFPANANCQPTELSTEQPKTEKPDEPSDTPADEPNAAPTTEESVDPEQPATDKPNSPSSTEESAESEEVPEAGDNCEIGSYALNPVNCNSFLQCVHGKFKVMPCPTDLHWNKEAQTCDYPANARCQEKPVEPTEIPTEEPIEPTEQPTEQPGTEEPIEPTEQPTKEPVEPTKEPIEPSEEPSTKGHTEPSNELTTESETVEPTKAPVFGCNCGETFPDPTACSSFFKCVDHQWIQETCTYGLHFNQETQLCDWPEIAQCPFNCECGDEISAYRSCETYYKCIDHKFVLHHCSAGLHWNSLTKECDWPQKAQCAWDNNTDKPETTPAATEAPNTEEAKTTEAQTELPTTERQTETPSTEAQTDAPTTDAPAEVPTTERQTEAPTTQEQKTTEAPTEVPTTERQTEAPTTQEQKTTEAPTEVPTTTPKPTEPPTVPTTSFTTLPTPTEAPTTEPDDYDYYDGGEITPPDWWGRKIQIHPRFKYLFNKR